MEIPAFHYMVAIFGGNCIPCAEYAAFGTQDASVNARRCAVAAAGHQLTLASRLRSFCHEVSILHKAAVVS